ncbi:MAG: dual specificity protein phosphatase family protein [Desulfurococcaceae archaeon]
MFTWIIEGKLAQSPLPSIYELENIIPKTFTGMISLTNWGETPAWLSHKVRSIGLEYLHLPTPDHYPVELIDLIRAVFFIKKHVERGGSVIVHCMGGVGRSGMVTVAFLISTGKNLYEALRYVRSKVPGSVENTWQHRMLENFELFINNVGLTMMQKYLDILLNSIREENEVRHVFKTIQMVIELYNWLSPSTTSILDELKNAMLHVHDDHISKKLENIVNPSDKPSILVDVAHSLDYKLDSRVVTTDLVENDKKTILLLCRDFCEDIVRETSRSYENISGYFENKIRFSWDDFMNYV